VECSAAGMDPEFLKSRTRGPPGVLGRERRHAPRAALWHASEVREQALRRCEIFSKNRGFVFNAIDNIQAGT